MRWWLVLCLVACDAGKDAAATDVGSTSDADPQQTPVGSSGMPSDTDGATGQLPPPMPATTTSAGNASSSGASVDDGTGGSGALPLVWIIATHPFTGSETPGFDGLVAFDAEYDEAACAEPVCDANTAPQIGEGRLWVNGAELPPGGEIHMGDRVGVLFPFEDAECNVACGTLAHFLSAPLNEGGGAGSAASNAPCGTASSEVWLGGEFYEVDEIGPHLAEVALTDACGAMSAYSGLTFDVVP